LRACLKDSAYTSMITICPCYGLTHTLTSDENTFVTLIWQSLKTQVVTVAHNPARTVIQIQCWV